MIFLHTGLPGAGKTLFTLAHVKPLAEKEGRQVYFFNIPQVMIPEWIEIDEEQFKKWYELPPNSIIIADEAQRIFRPRGAGTKVPEHVEKLETHRHLGLDLYLITQHPGLIDLNVRKLVGTHRHVVRSFGTKRAVIHSWSSCKDSCDKSRKDSVKSQFSYPKEVFNWYKSAEVHTHKMSIPFRLISIPLLFIFIAWACWYAYKGMVVDPVERAKSKSSAHGLVDASGVSGVSASRPVLSVSGYIDSVQPRIPDLLYTAPRYDELTFPVDAPFPVGCIQSGDRCRCYTSQATFYKASIEFCRNFIEHGFFRDWLPLSESSAIKTKHAD